MSTSRAPYAVKRALGEFDAQIAAKNVHINQLYDQLEAIRLALIEGRADEALTLVEMTLPRMPPAEPGDVSKADLATHGHEPELASPAAALDPNAPSARTSSGRGLALDPNQPLTVGVLLELLPMLQQPRPERVASRGVSVVEHEGAPPPRTRTTVIEHAPEPRKGPKVEYHD